MNDKEMQIDISNFFSYDSVDQPEENVTNVTDEIERGKILYEERKLSKRHNPIQPLYKTTKKHSRPFFVYKQYCSDKEKVIMDCKRELQCKHYGNVIINRDIMTTTEHFNLLAKPKYTQKKDLKCPQYHCYYVKRYPLSASSRIEQLSIPLEKTVINTWHQYSNIFTTRQIANLENLLYTSKHTNIAKALENIIEDKKLEKRHKLQRRKETAEIKRKIQILKGDHARQVMCSVAEILKNFLMNENEKILDTPNLQAESAVILKYIANILCIQKPSADSDNLLDQFLVNLSKNLAILMNNFLEHAGIRPYDKDANKNKRNKDSEICICKTDKKICGDLQISKKELEFSETSESEMESELETENEDEENKNENDTDNVGGKQESITEQDIEEPNKDEFASVTQDQEETAEEEGGD